MSDFIPGKERDELTLIIGNREIVINSGKLLKTIDTGCHAFTCNMPWEPEIDPEIDEITAPKSFSEVQIFIGGYLQMTGILYNVLQRQSMIGTYKEFGIFTKIADMVDSTWRTPFEENNIGLDTICINQAANFNIDVVLDSGVNVGGKFSRISVNQIEKCFFKLSQLAAQRGLLLSCNKDGDLLIIKPNVDGKPVGTLFPENNIAQDYITKFNGRKRYNQYDALTSSASSNRTAGKKQSIDSSIPGSRFLTFLADESLPGEGLDAAEWKRNKSAAESIEIQWPVNTWYAPNDELWQPNTTVTVKNPVISIDNGFTFLINQVLYDFTDKGTTAILNLKPPSMYELGDFEEPEWG
jgi:prophage tail gpP-like protein